MSARLVLHQDGRWLAFDAGTVVVLEGRPRVDRASIVLTDFDGAVSDVASLEGSPSHAVALIERRLRADGLIDGDGKILLHQVRTVGNGYQALYTAVPLDRWQHLFAWADQQEDHCLLVPTVALLWKHLRPGRGVVLHSGRKLVFLASLRSGAVYASALAFSDSDADLAMTVAALGERAGALLSADDGAIESLAIEWIGALTPLGASTDGGRSKATPHATATRTPAWMENDDTPTERQARASASGSSAEPSMSFDGQDEYTGEARGTEASPPVAVPVVAHDRRPAARDAAVAGAVPLDETLLEIFASNSGASVRLAPHVVLVDADGRRFRSGLLPLLPEASPAIAVNSGAARAMFVAERLLPWASVASLVLAIGLAALGGRWTLSAHESRTRAEAIRAQAEDIESRAFAIEAGQSIPAHYPDVLAFIGRATALGRALDPAATLLVVREAAGADVRILRLRLDPAPDGGIRLQVDGLVNHGASAAGPDRGQQVARFVQRLRDAGYVPVAVDPQAGNARAGAVGGVFSYQLTRATTTPATGGSP